MDQWSESLKSRDYANGRGFESQPHPFGRSKCPQKRFFAYFWYFPTISLKINSQLTYARIRTRIVTVEFKNPDH